MTHYLFSIGSASRELPFRDKPEQKRKERRTP